MRTIPFRSFTGPLLAGLLLTACTPAHQAVLEAGVAQVRQAKDAEAAVLKASLCAMSLGAYHRVLSEAEQGAADTLCGGVERRSSAFSIDELRLIREMMVLLREPE